MMFHLKEIYFTQIVCKLFEVSKTINYSKETDWQIGRIISCFWKLINLFLSLLWTILILLCITFIVRFFNKIVAILLV